MTVQFRTTGIANAPGEAPGAASDAIVVVLCAEEMLRDAIAYWLTAARARVHVAENGYAASRLLRAPKQGVLVTDRVLPPWPGLETFRALRARVADLRIAFVDSGNRDELSLARVTGVTDILPRPLTRQAVIAATVHLAHAPGRSAS